MEKVDKVDNEIELACIAIAALGFGVDKITEGFYRDVAEHIRGGELYLAFENSEPVAFRIISRKVEGVVYLAGAAKKPNSKRHLIREMTGQILEKENPQSVITRTGNDYVLEEMMYLTSKVVPIEKEASEETIELLAKCGLADKRMRRESLVTPGYYENGPMINSKLGRPQSKDPRVVDFMRKVMPDEEYFRGAAIILVGRRGGL